MRSLRVAALVSLAALPGLAQEPARRDSVVVTGSFEPLPLEELDRSVRLFLTARYALISDSFEDFLQLDPSVDLQRRAPGGIQADVSIRGSTFGQTLILVNGLRVNDVQSGHHNLDVPLPLDAISRVEILKGSGSMLYGSDAVGGVVNVVTQRPEASEFRLRGALGNFGINEERGRAAYARRKFSESLFFERDFSTGFQPDRDYRNLSAASLTHISTALGSTDITLGGADKPFGADQFYGNYNSWERTKTWFGAIRQELGERTEASFAYRRHADLFVLYRDRPQVYTNRHTDSTEQVSLRRSDPLGSLWNLHYGFEGYHDAVESTNLGDRRRNRGAVYLGADARVLRRASIAFGLREEVYAGLAQQLSPSVAGGYWVSQHLKFRASASRAFRLPTYTDLYYHDPANLGSPDLKPEKAWNYEGGIEWNHGSSLRGDVTIFERRLRDGIDYIRNSPADIWRATNFSRLNFSGAEASITWQLPAGQSVDMRYTWLRGTELPDAGAQSKYVFNYPRHSAVISWQGPLGKDWLARTRLGLTQRIARDPYALWDFSVARARGSWRPFLGVTNLSGTAYQEIAGVAMPRRGVIGGVEWVAFGRK